MWLDCVCLVDIVEACCEAVKKVRCEVAGAVALPNAFVIVEALCHGSPVLRVLLAE